MGGGWVRGGEGRIGWLISTKIHIEQQFLLIENLSLASFPFSQFTTFCCFHFRNFFAAAVRLVDRRAGRRGVAAAPNAFDIAFFSPPTCKDNKDFSQLGTFLFSSCFTFLFFFFVFWLIDLRSGRLTIAYCFISHTIRRYPGEVDCSKDLRLHCGPKNCIGCICWANKLPKQESWKKFKGPKLVVLPLCVRLAACAMHISRVVSWVLRPASWIRCHPRPVHCPFGRAPFPPPASLLPRCWVFSAAAFCLICEIAICWLSGWTRLVLVLRRPHPTLTPSAYAG